MFENKQIEFNDEIDSYVRKYIKNGPIFCSAHNLDIIVYYETIIKSLREGTEKDKAIGVKLARKLLDLKILNWKN